LSDDTFGQIFISLVVLAFSLSFHEMAHAWTALRLGDDTAYNAGRVSMNPVVHVDPIGTIVLPLLSIMATVSGYPVPMIGWAKPVPFSVRKLSRPRRDVILIASAGPASNLLLALLVATASHVLWPSISELDRGIARPLGFLMGSAVVVNLTLMLFNLVPIPPLDGGRILSNLLPLRPGLVFDELAGQYGAILLMVLVLTGAIGGVLMPVTFALATMLLPS
jgi:Zn-dependent protease